MTIEELSNLYARDFIEECWGTEIVDVINRQKITPMTVSEFFEHCTVCGAAWNAMLLTGVKDLYTEVYDAIPNDMGKYAFKCICGTLELLQIVRDRDEQK